MTHTLVGKSIADYELVEQLGAGGMALVYRARGGPDLPDVAIKVLPFHLAANDALRQRFLREARMVTLLKHPHILPVYDFGEEAGVPYMVMKLVDGGTLDAFVREGPLALALIVRVIADVASALDYAHRQNVIHRDLKPENILFDAEGNIYLSDFGVARLREATVAITGTGGFIGTAAYASPEQCRGDRLTPASDIYSLGVMLFEMLTGRQPFSGNTPLALMHQHLTETAPNPLKYRPGLPLDMAEVTRKALAKLPHVRYQTATALSDALSASLAETLGTLTPPPAPPRGPDPVFNSQRKTPPPPVPDALIAEASPTRPERPVPHSSAPPASAITDETPTQPAPAVPQRPPTPPPLTGPDARRVPQSRAKPAPARPVPAAPAPNSYNMILVAMMIAALLIMIVTLLVASMA